MSRSLAVSYVLIVAVFGWFATYGSGDFFDSEWLSASYDSLAQQLLRAEADVDPKAISFEGLRRDGKTFMYFGPFPALLRIVPNALLPSLSGQWGRLSCFVAATLCAVAFGFAVVRALRCNGSLNSGQRNQLAVLLVLSFSLGTPLLYLDSCGRIFHEASLWGLCGALWSIYALLLICASPKRDTLGRWLFSVALAVSLLSRITYALPLCLAAPLILLWGLKESAEKDSSVARTFVRRLLMLSPALIAGALQLWYNYERFGSLFKFFDYGSFYIDPRDFGAEFNIARLPTTLWHYFGFFPGYLSSMPPFVRMVNSEISRPELFMPHWREQTISLTFSSCGIMFFAALGLPRLLRRQAPTLLTVVAACFVAQALVILTYFFITQRYAAEFLPLLAVLVAAAAMTVTHSRRLVLTLGTLSSFSIAFTVLSDLDWSMMYNQHGPNAYRRWLAESLLPPIVLAEGTDRVYLSDMTPLEEHHSGSKTQPDRSAVNNPLIRIGTLFPKGLGMRANASSTYAIPEDRNRLQAIIMPANESEHCFDSSMEFQVISERGESLFQSGVMRPRALPQTLDIPLGDSRSVTLILSDAGDGSNCDLGNWNLAAFAKRQ